MNPDSTLRHVSIGKDYLAVLSAIESLAELERRGTITKEKFDSFIGQLAEECAQAWLAKLIAESE
jgi:hypothetical protein